MTLANHENFREPGKDGEDGAGRSSGLTFFSFRAAGVANPSNQFARCEITPVNILIQR